MAVTPDKYELPIYICDTGEELAQKLNISRNTVFSSITRSENGTRTGRKIVRVKIDE